MSQMSGTSRQNGSATARQEGANASEPLRRLKSREITVDEYLDYQADAAIEHLRKVLRAEDLRSVREVVRAQISTDPVIADMIAKLVGNEPSPAPRG